MRVSGALPASLCSFVLTVGGGSGGIGVMNSRHENTSGCLCVKFPFMAFAFFQHGCEISDKFCYDIRATQTTKKRLKGQAGLQ